MFQEVKADVQWFSISKVKTRNVTLKIKSAFNPKFIAMNLHFINNGLKCKILIKLIF